jgi:hypothetical protein
MVLCTSAGYLSSCDAAQDDSHHDTYSATFSAPVPVRTMTTSQAGGASDSHTLDSHPTYPTTVELKINGDLDKMAEDWTQEEMIAKRRVVQFGRSHHDNTISVVFTPIDPELWSVDKICVNCIWWEKMNDFYVTSTEIINLAQELIRVRFTTEVKNRMGRYLDAFHPFTVSNTIKESEEFLNVIIGLPDPNPHNRQRRIRVHKWKTLSNALKKILNKFTLPSKKPVSN